ncbi:ribonuclease H [Sesbania bispinosa]|nr:ribonuclease H [Sesbania bispinosa]
MVSSLSNLVITLHLLRVEAKAKVAAWADHSLSIGGRSSGPSSASQNICTSCGGSCIDPYLDCIWIKEAWRNSPLGDKIPTSTTNPIGGWIDDLISSLQQDSVMLFFALCYSFWNTCNKKIFEQKEVSLPLMYTKAVMHAWSLRTDCLSLLPIASLHKRGLNAGYPPPTGFYKINVDAALGGGNSWGCGIIIRDSEGGRLSCCFPEVQLLPGCKCC